MPEKGESNDKGEVLHMDSYLQHILKTFLGINGLTDDHRKVETEKEEDLIKYLQARKRPTSPEGGTDAGVGVC